jgi:hypothetical protein
MNDMVDQGVSSNKCLHMELKKEIARFPSNAHTVIVGIDDSVRGRDYCAILYV